MESFLVLGKSVRGLACREFILQVLRSPQVHNFSEFLELPNILELGQSELAPYLHLLKIFSVGTLLDYQSSASTLPALDEAMLLKLKILTLMSLAQSAKTLSYPSLLEALKISSIRELEDVVIEAIYRGLLGGKLDQQNQLVEVHFAASRDLREGDIDAMIELLSSWGESCESVMGALSHKIEEGNIRKMALKAAEETTLSNIESVKLALRTEEGSLLSRFDDMADDVRRPKGLNDPRSSAGAIGLG